MIKQKATVVAENENTIWVDTERESTCSQCQVKQGCGTGLLENHVGKRFSRIAVAKETTVSVGEKVQIGIPEAPLLVGALMMYIVPLMMMFFFATSARYLELSELFEVICGVVGLMAGFYLVHLKFRHNKTGLQAKIVEDEK
jgi:sigma-E factor negative regulatory protein RseC